ncbi:hypothetical protein [Nocardioides limicola]|uniref:hypothetical protein n=1 Tax=Nocardioides limicola TaxID=2803368 RepID=UPI00193BF8CD|nr:hypothetical protein [Nocardioides sp. DJM-14]
MTNSGDSGQESVRDVGRSFLRNALDDLGFEVQVALIALAVIVPCGVVGYLVGSVDGAIIGALVGVGLLVVGVAVVAVSWLREVVSARRGRR